MRLLYLFASLVFFAAQCQNSQPKAPLQRPAKWEELPKDFAAFYEKFHTDSAFQMGHIEWPLKGEKEEAGPDSTLRQQLHEWEPETWRTMRLPETGWSSLKRSYEMLGDVMVIERMSYPMVGFGFERQFYKDEQGQWQLIYYAEKQMAQ